MVFDPESISELGAVRHPCNPVHSLAAVLLAHSIFPLRSGLFQGSQNLPSIGSRKYFARCRRSARTIFIESHDPAQDETMIFKSKTVEYKKGERGKLEKYRVNILPASSLRKAETCPPMLCIPPVGVGISHAFFQPLLREWYAIGAPCEIHAPDLLGCGSATPKPRRFYTPEVWADQLLEYISVNIKRPVILVVQGGLLPVALEMWRKAGKSAISGVSFISPPPLRFFMPAAEPERGVRSRFQEKPAGRGRQRLFWLLSQSPIGGMFFRYLRAGEGQPRIKNFSERNLFAKSENVDAKWMEMCYEGSRDTRSRFATLAYLCGTAPGGSWRDDRSNLLKSLSVPTQVLRGDTAEEAQQRLDSFLANVPRPSCCGLVPNGRSVIPYENAKDTAAMLARFIAQEFQADLATNHSDA